MSTIDLIVPGLLGPFSADISNNIPAHISQQLNDAEFQPLKKWLAKADVLTYSSTNYYSTLCNKLGAGLTPDISRLSLCEITCRYDGIHTEEGYFYRADPVHFKAESDHALLLGSQLISPTQEEVNELVAVFNQHFQQDNISLHATDSQRWYLRCSRPLDLKFYALDYSLGRDIKHFLPQGADALWWRRILNEAQMLFFQHKVNQQRESDGKLTINGLWLWDLSVNIEPSENRAIFADKIYADNVESIALADLIKEERVSLSVASYKKSDSFEANSIIVTEQLYEAVCYGDIDAWLEALRGYCSNFFLKMSDMLKTGQLDELNIYPCDGRVFKLKRKQLIKFWKPVKNIDTYFSVPDE